MFTRVRCQTCNYSYTYILIQITLRVLGFELVTVKDFSLYYFYV